MDRPAVRAAFAALEKHRAEIAGRRTIDLFTQDARRFEHFSVRLDDLLFDYAVRHLSYPEPAASNGEAGTVIIRVTIARDGTVTDVKLVKSSIYRPLDLNTLNVYRGKKMPPLPDDMTGPTHDFTLAVEYELITVYR